MTPFRHIAIILALTTPAIAQSILSFDDERAAGRLNNPQETNLMLCPLKPPCREIGKIGTDNIIRWNDTVTLEDLKGIVQNLQDFTRWQINRYRQDGTPG